MNTRMDIAVDLLWLKPNNIGGAETVLRTLLDTFLLLDAPYRFVLFTTKDNAYSFNKYEMNKDKFKIVICPINTLPIWKRLIWQNYSLAKLIRKMGIKYYFCPVYIRPLIRMKNIKSVIIVHDLQQLHYPEYFTKMRYIWCKYSWKRNISITDKIVTISQFCKQDIIKYYGTPEEKIEVIYNPISDMEVYENFDKIAEKYQIEANKYYYTVSSPLKHKNLTTIIEVINQLVKNEEKELPIKLLISGISGGISEELSEYIKVNKLEKNCIMTGFVSDQERNALIKNCSIFLFPSVFEGFGMPVIEAMKLGKKVITTKCTSIPEVSQGKAIYVEDPYSIQEWIDNIRMTEKENYSTYCTFREYDAFQIGRKYLEVFRDVYK